MERLVCQTNSTRNRYLGFTAYMRIPLVITVYF